MLKPTFLSDVDEVLGDFQTPVLAVMSKILGKTMRPQDFTAWDIFAGQPIEVIQEVRRYVEAPGFCYSIQPREGAKDFILELREQCEVYAVTSPWHSQHWMWERTQWLMDHFGFKKQEIVHTSAKFLCTGDFLLDDNPDHCEKWAKRHTNGEALLFHIPNTRDIQTERSTRVYTWPEILSYVWKHQQVVQSG